MVTVRPPHLVSRSYTAQGMAEVGPLCSSAHVPGSSRKGGRASWRGWPQPSHLPSRHSMQCVNELNQWLSALRKMSISNPGLLGSYHPGIFRGDKWSCCHQKDKSGERGGLYPLTLHLSTTGSRVLAGTGAFEPWLVGLAGEPPVHLRGLIGGRLVPAGAPGGKGSVTG